MLACATHQIEVAFDEEEDFSALRSFAWYPHGTPGEADERQSHPEHFAAADRSVERSLLEKGFRKATPEAADFLVSYYMSLERGFDTRIVHQRYGKHGANWELQQVSPRQETIEYERGTLVIDVLDTRLRRLVWRGTATQRFDFGELPQPDHVEQRASELLARFPPTP